MANRPLTKKEWMAYLEKACDEFDWEGASKPCPNCEYHKNRAARWRAEAYKQAGHDVIELPWVGLTNEEIAEIMVQIWSNNNISVRERSHRLARAIEAKLKEKNT